MLRRGDNHHKIVPLSVLFSEPKIPQSTDGNEIEPLESLSVLFSEPKIPQYGLPEPETVATLELSVLFSEPKIPQFRSDNPTYPSIELSVLFSEPKIPQFIVADNTLHLRLPFSALQRAENSSIAAGDGG